MYVNRRVVTVVIVARQGCWLGLTAARYEAGLLVAGGSGTNVLTTASSRDSLVDPAMHGKRINCHAWHSAQNSVL